MRKIFVMLLVVSGTARPYAQERLSPKEFKNKLAATPDALLLDVRTQQEINKGYLKGAVFMDFYDSTFKEQVANLDKKKPVFIYCAIGGRSWDAAKLMTEMGFRHVYDLKGGIIIWKIRNYAFVKLKNDSARQGITRTDFEKQLKNNELTLVDFYAPWCAPCKIMAPALEKMEQKMKDTTTIVKINADENLQLMKDYGLQALPYILLFRGSKIIYRHEGFMSEEAMKQIVRKFAIE